MKVFISWSGEKSKDFALGLKSWLPFVIHDLQPWVSDADIDSGTMSMESIHTQLLDTRYGIICTTAENQAKPWVNYEAGVLWKSLDSSTNVVPLLIDIERSAVNSPLKNFQSRTLTSPATRKSEAQKLVTSLNAARDSPVNEQVLDESFETQWPKLERLIEHVASNTYAYKSEMSPGQRKLEDIHQSVLTLTEAHRSAANAAIDGIDEILERKGSLAYGSFSEEMSSRQSRFEKIINNSLIARGSYDRAHVQRVNPFHYVVYSDVSLPDEVKQELLEVPTSTKNEIEFEFRLTMLDEPDEDPKYL